jgi:serine phosphatase RsbU (regulator of sigma subunit)
VDKGPVIIAQSVIDKQVMRGKVVQIADMVHDPRVLYPAEAAQEGLRSGLAVPLVTKGRVIGALHLYSSEPHVFTEHEVRTIRALANLAATAIENAALYKASLEKQALDRELSVAHEIQQRLLPQTSPRVAGFDISAVSRPCHQVGGDFYDFIPLDDEHLAFVIADVAGKGVPGAILMASTRAVLRAQVEYAPGARPSRVASRVNRVLYRDTSSSQFVSLFYGVLHLKARQLVYTNAGHNRPFCLGDQIIYLDRGGVVLGALPRETYAQGRLELHRGDVLVFYTDGITEAMHPKKADTFGEDRLLQVVTKNRRRRAAEIVRAILDDVRAFTRGAPASDDRTLMIIKVR